MGFLCFGIFWKRTPQINSLSSFSFLVIFFFASKGYPFKIIFDFTTAGDWDCVAAVERLPALHYSVDFIFLSFGFMDFTVEL